MLQEFLLSFFPTPLWRGITNSILFLFLCYLVVAACVNLLHCYSRIVEQRYALVQYKYLAQSFYKPTEHKPHAEEGQDTDQQGRRSRAQKAWAEDRSLEGRAPQACGFSSSAHAARLKPPTNVNSREFRGLGTGTPRAWASLFIFKISVRKP